MSAIACLVNFEGAPVDTELLHRMADCVAFRGPDGIHFWNGGHVAMVHLAMHTTPEACREKQPLLSPDGQVCLVADARIDNRQGLMHDLVRAQGHRMDATPTDADLIMAAYLCWGKDCFGHLLGDFAIIIWDGRTRELLAARDPFGVKPLHFAQVGNLLCLATEVLQILEWPAVPRRLDELALADLLLGRFGDNLLTLFQDIRKIPLAGRLLASDGHVQVERYWDVNPKHSIRHRTDADYAAHFLDLFRQAVGDRLRTNVPVIGATVSGGMDSTSVAAVGHQILQCSKGAARLVCRSLVFDTLPNCDEREYTRTLADELGLDIEYLPADKYWFLSEPLHFRPHLETTCLWNDAADRELLRRFREQGARVVLTGHGGDVLAGNHFIYSDRLMRGQLGAVRDVWQMAQRRRISPGTAIYKLLLRPLLPESIAKILRGFRLRRKTTQIPPWLSAEFVNRNMLEELVNKELTIKFKRPARQAIYQLATRMGSVPAGVHCLDSVAARFGLEIRHPLMDRRLIEFVVAIPPEQHLKNGFTKWILRQAMQGILPEKIRTRREKTNFNDFTALSLGCNARDQIAPLLAKPCLAKLDVLNPTEFRLLSNRFETEKGMMPSFPLIAVELWLAAQGSLFNHDPAVRDANREG